VKGRKFNGHDIKTLMLIHKFLQARRGIEIEKVLTGEVSSADAELFDIQNFVELIERFETMQKKMLLIEKRITVLREHLPTWELSTLDRMKKLDEKFRHHEERIHLLELKRKGKTLDAQQQAERDRNEKQAMGIFVADDRSLLEKIVGKFIDT